MIARETILVADEARARHMAAQRLTASSGYAAVGVYEGYNLRFRLSAADRLGEDAPDRTSSKANQRSFLTEFPVRHPLGGFSMGEGADPETKADRSLEA